MSRSISGCIGCERVFGVVQPHLRRSKLIGEDQSDGMNLTEGWALLHDPWG